MIRTQIYLREEQKRRLIEESANTGLSIAELIRRLINEHYGTKQRDVES